MAKLDLPPTKSSLLTLQDQLAFAEEGFDLLEQKRQILVFELMSRLGRARDAERRIEAALAPAFRALRSAHLDMGSAAVERATLAVRMDQRVEIADQQVMGLRIPTVEASVEPASAQFGVGGTSASADRAARQFTEVLPLLAELAELENTVLRLSRELRKTQRRCNALTKIFIPNYRETLEFIVSNLDERERESFVILKMIKKRLDRKDGEEVAHA